MSVENHVVSLGLSKELKEAGYPQEGEFWWYRYKPSGIKFTLLRYSHESFEYARSVNSPYVEYFAAPLASELMERLPDEFFPTKHLEQGGWAIMANCEPSNTPYLIYKDCLIRSEKLCDALALMWLYLRREGVI